MSVSNRIGKLTRIVVFCSCYVCSVIIALCCYAPSVIIALCCCYSSNVILALCCCYAPNVIVALCCCYRPDISSSPSTNISLKHAGKKLLLSYIRFRQRRSVRITQTVHTRESHIPTNINLRIYEDTRNQHSMPTQLQTFY